MSKKLRLVRRKKCERNKPIPSWGRIVTAEKEYLCDHCCCYIHPGDLYQREVWVFGRRLVVLRNHVDPFCPCDPDEDYREMEKYNREHGGDTQSSNTEVGRAA